MNPIYFESPFQWRAWLAQNHEKESELWVGFHKKKTGQPSLVWAESVEQALCFGWIDGIRKTVDEQRFLIRFTPRRSKSAWSKINVEIAKRLIEQGLMEEAGLREARAAEEDGRWQATYNPPSTSETPADLQKELLANPAAMEFYHTLSKRNLYAIHYRIESAKRPETRQKRVREFVEMLSRGEKLYP
ncbi:MAG TPA: YdeI/OmpD-associated family protein [Capsulimonadaceae bacterium]|nr:YdeI/OmpD-associated family protein [Capsulimonadaceae bacterium]